MSSPNNKTTNTEYTHALTEAQTRLEALTTTFAMFIDEHKEPDILGLQCVIDDADRLAGTVRQLYQLTKNGKAAQQPEPIGPTQNKTDQADDLYNLDPDYRHHDLCPDAQDTFWFYETIKRNGFMTGSSINLNRRAYLAEGGSESNRDDAYGSVLSVCLLFRDNRALTRAWIAAAGPNDALAEIDAITTRSIDTLSSFTDLLAGVEPISTSHVMDVFDSITSAINSINAVIDASGNNSETKQA